MSFHSEQLPEFGLYVLGAVAATAFIFWVATGVVAGQGTYGTISRILFLGGAVVCLAVVAGVVQVPM